MKTRHVLLGLALSAAASGIAFAAEDNKPRYVAASYEANGIQITPTSVYVTDDRLVFKMHLWNKTDKKVVVDRDAMSLKTSAGKTVAKRYKGMMTGFGMTDSKHEVEANSGHDVWVEFVVGKASPSGANLIFNDSVVSGGQSLDLPDYVVAKTVKK